MRDIDITNLAAAQSAGAVIVDVREPMEFVGGHVPGARLMPMSQLASRLGELDRSQRVYVICATGNRSRSMTALLEAQGFDAFNVVGGTAAWARAGLPIERGIPAAA